MISYLLSCLILLSCCLFLPILRPCRSTLSSSSAASDVYKRQVLPYLPGHEVAVYTCFEPDSSYFYASPDYAQQYLNEGAEKADALCIEAATIITKSTGLCSIQRVVEVINERSNIAQAMVGAAKQLLVDVVVLGTRGLGEIRSKLLGSVAQSVLFETTSDDTPAIPVLVVHQGATAAREANGHSVLFPVDCSQESLAGGGKGAPVIQEGLRGLCFHAAEAPRKC
eukprot:TRINITY_DN8609_c0_g1_i2.p1 TRINITY_DN8609_c0_g1~~TRINITY_DN8609_c0_g1_i2.p1  ORF type:complete len:225 (+),score=23.96 TRINITY_DN8609_c0_g1_i2:54-728(+)